MVDGLPPCFDVVDADVRVDGVLAAGRNDLYPEEFQALAFRVLDREGHHDDSIDLPAGRKALEEVAAVLEVPDVVEQDVEFGVPEHHLQRLDHGAEEPAGQVGDDQGDPAGRAAGQVGCLG